MPAKRQANGLTIKQEAFARAFVLTGNASEAYRQAYNVADTTKQATIARHAHEVMKDAKVAAMIARLREESAQKHGITVERVTQMLLEDRRLAHDCRQAGAAVAANMALAKLHGLIVERKHVTLKHDPSDLTDAELADIAAGRSRFAVAEEECEAGADQLH